MTPAPEKAIASRVLSATLENKLRLIYANTFPERDIFAELDAERSISRLLASALHTARLQCDDPTRRKIGAVLEKYEGERIA